MITTKYVNSVVKKTRKNTFSEKLLQKVLAVSSVYRNNSNVINYEKKETVIYNGLLIKYIFFNYFDSY